MNRDGSIVPLSGTVMARVVRNSPVCCTGKETGCGLGWRLPSSPHALGSLVAETLFPVGPVKCDTTPSARRPALFRLLRFLLKVVDFRKGLLSSLYPAAVVP